MNLDKYLKKIKEFLNKYIKILLYGIFCVILLVVMWFSYSKVYMTAVSPKPIADSEIIAKKQKVNVTKFKEIEEIIQNKDKDSIKKIDNIFEK